MIRYVTRVASVLGQRWRNIFQRQARPLAAIKAGDSGRVTTLRSVYDGFLCQHSRRKNEILTKVIDPPGHYMGIVTHYPEPAFVLPLASSYMFDAPARDAFYPRLNIVTPATGFFRAVERREAAASFGTAFTGLPDDIIGYRVVVSAPYEWRGVHYQRAISNMEQAFGLGILGQTVSPGAEFAQVFAYVRQPILSASLQGSLTTVVYENAYEQMLPGIKMITRYPLGAVVGRQMPFGGCAWRDTRLVSAFPLAEQVGEGFTHRAGMTAIALLYHVLADGRFVTRTQYLRLDDMDLGGIKPEQWTPGGWVQDFTDNIGSSRQIHYPPAYDETVDGWMSCVFGKPVVCLKQNSAEVLVDIRVARKFLDTRGIERYPELNPVSIQTQTAVLKLTLPNFMEDMQPGEIDGTGDLSVEVILRDASGSIESGAYEQFGGTNEDHHAVWRTEWSGIAGEKHVALISEVRFIREEEERQGSDWLMSPQSSFSGDRAVRVYTVSEESGLTGQVTYQSKAPELVEEPAAIVLYCDGDMQTLQLDSSLVHDVDNMGSADIRHPLESHTWATVAGDDLVFFAAYSYPEPDEAIVYRWDLDTGEVTEIRRDPAVHNGQRLRPALSCYQREIRRDDAVIEKPCIIYRLGNQVGYGRAWVSKDYGAEWLDLINAEQEAPTFTPAMGLFYMGSPIWPIDYGDAFKRYRESGV